MPSASKQPSISRRELGKRILAGAAATQLQVHAQSANRGPVLDIADYSYWFYGVERVTLARGTVINGSQMFVERWIPTEVRHPYPVVLVHGGYGQGSDWISTPDGRRGWAPLFLEQGYKVFVVDRPGQGRNPFVAWAHGLFDEQAPTFERAAASVRGGQGHSQWPGSTTAQDSSVAQVLAAMGQPMGNNAVTQSVWRTRGVMLLEDIGPSIFVTHGDGAVFAWATAQQKPELVKGIVAVEQTPNSLQGQGQMRKLSTVPVAVVTAEASPGTADAGMVATLGQAGVPADHLRLAEKGVHGNGPMVMMERNNREALAPILEWLAQTVEKTPSPVTPGVDPNRNRESTAVRLADMGSFWIGVQRKRTGYGEVALGQSFVQYMIPAERRHEYPVIMIHGGGGQGTHMMGIGNRPGWVHYFVQAGYAVYWLDRPGFGRSPVHPDTLGQSHIRNVPPYEGLLTSTGVFNTAQWPGRATMEDVNVGQFMACEVGNVSDEVLHSEVAWAGGVELVDRLGPSILLTHAFGGFWGWGVADRRPNLVKAIFAMEPNGNPFAAQLKWGLTAGPMTYDPPVTDPSQFRLVDVTAPTDAPRPIVSPYKLQAEPARKWKNLQTIPMGWLTSEYGAGGSPITNMAFLKQVGCQVDLVRLRDHGIYGNGNLMLLDKNNHEVFAVIRDWLDKHVG